MMKSIDFDAIHLDCVHCFSVMFCPPRDSHHILAAERLSISNRSSPIIRGP